MFTKNHGICNESDGAIFKTGSFLYADFRIRNWNTENAKCFDDYLHQMETKCQFG